MINPFRVNIDKLVVKGHLRSNKGRNGVTTKNLPLLEG